MCSGLRTAGGLPRGTGSQHTAAATHSLNLLLLTAAGVHYLLNPMDASACMRVRSTSSGCMQRVGWSEWSPRNSSVAQAQPACTQTPAWCVTWTHALIIAPEAAPESADAIAGGFCLGCCCCCCCSCCALGMASAVTVAAYKDQITNQWMRQERLRLLFCGAMGLIQVLLLL